MTSGRPEQKSIGGPTAVPLVPEEAAVPPEMQDLSIRNPLSRVALVTPAFWEQRNAQSAGIGWSWESPSWKAAG